MLNRPRFWRYRNLVALLQWRAFMREWIERLGKIQDDMASRPLDLSLTYPARLNVSISN